MIDSKELRIGNVVNSPEDEIVFIESVDEKWCSVRNIGDGEFHDSYGCPIGNLEPIPLSPELLIKCGFTKYRYPDHSERKMKEMYFINSGYIHITFVMGETVLAGKSYSDTDSQVILSKSIRHLHHLQNLFFSLNNSELKIEL